MIALKLSRHSYSYREDNLLDAWAYIGALVNYVGEFGYKDLEKDVKLGEKSDENK